VLLFGLFFSDPFQHLKLYAANLERFEPLENTGFAIKKTHNTARVMIARLAVSILRSGGT
jgi:hypothetical protein